MRVIINDYRIEFKEVKRGINILCQYEFERRISVPVTYYGYGIDLTGINRVSRKYRNMEVEDALEIVIKDLRRAYFGGNGSWAFIHDPLGVPFIFCVHRACNELFNMDYAFGFRTFVRKLLKG